MRPSTTEGVGRRWWRPTAVGMAALLLLTLLAVASAPPAAAAATSLRFGGGGSTTPTLDRVNVPVAFNNAADVGEDDFTLEFWMKSTRAQNPSGNVGCSSINWINGHIIFDRDINGSAGRDYGISVGQDGTLAFGASANGDGSAQTTCTTGVNVLDGAWHHVAAQRTASSGRLEIFVDGTRRADEIGPPGDISLPSASVGVPDRLLVIGAEKHDFPNYWSYEGLLDEVRLSDVRRYTGAFTPPTTAFTDDGSTAVLYHFDGTGGQVCAASLDDSSANNLDGGCASTATVPRHDADTPFGPAPTTTTQPTTTTAATTTSTTTTTQPTTTTAATTTTSTTTTTTTSTTTTQPTTTTAATTTTTQPTTTTATTEPTTTTTTQPTTTTAATTTTTVPPPPSAESAFNPITPVRLYDSRPNPVGALQTAQVVVAGVGEVPADATAVTLNLTVVVPAGPGFLTAYPCGQPRPNVSHVNHGAGQTLANLATVGIGTGGRVCIFTLAYTHIVVDITGWWGPVGEGFQTITPARFLDTRPARAATSQTLAIQVAGVNGVPADATAVAANLTITDNPYFGYLTAFPCDTPRPLASNLNYAPGQTITNLASVKLSADGRLCVFVSNTTAVVIDISGWWGPGASSELAPLGPATRLVDTRPVLMPFGSTLEVAVPGGVDAVAVNLTVTGAQAPGYLTAYPCGTVRPPTSNLNFAIGELISGAAMVAPGANGKVCVYFNAPTYFVADLFGELT